MTISDPPALWDRLTRLDVDESVALVEPAGADIDLVNIDVDFAISTTTQQNDVSALPGGDQPDSTILVTCALEGYIARSAID